MGQWFFALFYIIVLAMRINAFCVNFKERIFCLIYLVGFSISYVFKLINIQGLVVIAKKAWGLLPTSTVNQQRKKVILLPDQSKRNLETKRVHSSKKSMHGRYWGFWTQMTYGFRQNFPPIQINICWQSIRTSLLGKELIYSQGLFKFSDARPEKF